jgi:hypothetical protein
MKLMKFVEDLFKKNFTKYFMTGVVMTILTTFLMWFFVDIVGYLAVYVNPIMNTCVFLLKFITYHKIKMFNKNRSNFFKYLGVWLFLLVLSTFLLWIFVDIMGLWVVFVTLCVVVLNFILRFIIYKQINMLNS